MLIMQACFHKFILYLATILSRIGPNTDSLIMALSAIRSVKDHIRGPADGGFNVPGTAGQGPAGDAVTVRGTKLFAELPIASTDACTHRFAFRLAVAGEPTGSRRDRRLPAAQGSWAGPCTRQGRSGIGTQV